MDKVKRDVKAGLAQIKKRGGEPLFSDRIVLIHKHMIQAEQFRKPQVLFLKYQHDATW